MNNKNVTVLFGKSLPWMCISFLANLVAFSPLYFIFPAMKSFLLEVLPIRERIYAIFYPMRNIPLMSFLAEKSERVAEFVLLLGWLYVSIALSTILLNMIRSYLTYVLKAGHISVVGAFIREVPVQSQLSFGVKEIIRRFGSVNLMFAGDMLTRKVVLEINSMLFRDDGRLPEFIKRSKFLCGYAQKLVRALLIHLDEVLLSYVMAKEGNVWKLYCEGLGKYLKCWKGIIKDSLKSVFLVSVLSGLLHVFVYLLVFVSMRKYDLYTIVLALALARYLMFCVKVTFIEAYEYIRMLVVFYERIANEEVEEGMLERLKEFFPSLKKLLKRGGISETVSEASNNLYQDLSFDGADFAELTQLAESRLIPEDLEPGNYLQRIRNRLRRRTDGSVQE